MENTKPFMMSPVKVFWQNPIMRCLTCRRWRKKTKLEKDIKLGEKRIEKQLDVRSLILNQNLLHTMIRLLVKPRSKRELMRIQRRHTILEKKVKNKIEDEGLTMDKNAGSSSSDDESDLTISVGNDRKIRKKILSDL